MNVQEQILEKIKAYDKIVIHRHISPDPDALGSTLGFKKLIEDNLNGKDVRVVGYQEKNLEWLGRMDQAGDAFYEGALVIVMDTANSSRIDNKNFNKGAHLIKIDHHPSEDQYGHLNFVDKGAASVCEMVTHLALGYGWKISLEVATLLYAGIVSDTGRFLYDTVTPQTFEAAKYLLTLGIDVNELNRNLYKKPMNVLKAQAYVLNHFEVTEHGVAYFKMSKEIQKEFGLTTGTRSLLVDVLANIEGVLVRVCFFEQDKDQIRANIRSEGPIINQIAERYDGGGHPKASGAMLKKWEVATDLITELDLVCQYFGEE
ncbi:MAG: bifunctional oligoribonuclease/PAP phosphatase NrnA [Defluviitaleaceae bacterium]|nr:bifunctional oligoribonuclease/PAP phosphatase NrnA [Defluviitaleaceae bacterium]